MAQDLKNLAQQAEQQPSAAARIEAERAAAEQAAKKPGQAR